MTNNEIAQKIDKLAQELFDLGRTCTSQHFNEGGKLRSALCIAGEFMKNTSFTLDTIHDEIITEE
jgi:hypothetical protein